MWNNLFNKKSGLVSTENIVDNEIRRVLQALQEPGEAPATLWIKDLEVRRVVEAIIDGGEIPSTFLIKDPETRRVLDSIIENL